MTKYKEYVQKMLTDNKTVFENFRILHDSYALSPEKHQGEFNIEGEKILEIVREYENRLCANTERGMYNKFSTNLSEKFQNEVRAVFPMIDHIGLKSEEKKESMEKFVLKKLI